MRRWARSVVAALLLAGLSGCATQTVRLSQAGFEAFETLRRLPPEARPRIVVAPIRDQTVENGQSRLAAGLAAAPASAQPEQLLAGVQDLLLTGLLNTGAFTVLERDDLDALTTEQWLRLQANEPVSVDGRLEGADLVVAAAITGFEPAGGEAFPIPIPLSDRGDFGILWLRRGTAAVSMDLRVLDVRTARVVHATAVRGKARSFRADFDLFLRGNDRYTSLPGVLGYYNNTPLHAALLEMIQLAVQRVGEAAEPVPPLSPLAGP